MIIDFLKKYLSIIFIVATLMGVFHHHEDLKQHNDCQICTIQSNLSNIDTPVDVTYLTLLEISSETTITKLTNLISNKIQKTDNARAPPKIS